MTDRREQVRANANYLRNVRPIDPDEICEYVEGAPHPAVVRELLREEAVELGLVEREDGTFVPVTDEPVEPTFRGVERLPERYERRVEELLVEQYGPGWPEGDPGERLRGIIRRFKEEYYRQHPVEYDYEVALGYAIYHLPAYYAGVQYVLAELVERGLLSRRLRVLDVGAGTGGPALGLHDFLSGESSESHAEGGEMKSRAALVDYHAIEPSDAADVLDALLESTGRNFHPAVHRTTAEAFDPEGEYDLLLFANVLSELDDPVAVVERYRDHLAADGSLVAVEPADLNTSTGLREVERAVEDGLSVYSPTLRLWPGERPADRGWSFAVQPDLAVPSFQRALDDGSGEFVNVDVQYSHVVMRRDGKRRHEFTPSPERAAKMAETDDHVTERVNVVGVKLSHDLAEGGENPVFKVGDGSERVGHFAVLTKETTLNRALVEAAYGDVLAFERVLVLWNDDEGAYNLVVDEGTVVDRIPA